MLADFTFATTCGRATTVGWATSHHCRLCLGAGATGQNLYPQTANSSGPPTTNRSLPNKWTGPLSLSNGLPWKQILRQRTPQTMNNRPTTNNSLLYPHPSNPHLLVPSTHPRPRCRQTFRRGAKTTWIWRRTVVTWAQRTMKTTILASLPSQTCTTPAACHQDNKMDTISTTMVTTNTITHLVATTQHTIMGVDTHPGGTSGQQVPME